MTSCSSNIFIIATVYLGVIFSPSHGFNVIQPAHRTVNPDQSASISCEHNEPVEDVQDVRLNGISPTGKRSMLCQKGMEHCENITMYRENNKKFTFILLNIGPEMMETTYECEMTLTIGDIDKPGNGTPTRLLPGQKEAEQPCSPPTNPPLPQPGSDLVRWILIGLLTLMLLYSCIITSFYIRLMKSDDRQECENSTYVEMRTAPRQRNADFSAYSG